MIALPASAVLLGLRLATVLGSENVLPDRYSACQRVNVWLSDTETCQAYEDLPLNATNAQACSSRKVPRIYHVVAEEEVAPALVRMQSSVNTAYRLNYHSDASARKYIEKHCGKQMAQAYSCFVPAAFRADLFRFCALHAEGGLYLDADLIPVVPLDELYDPCAPVSAGHDIADADGIYGVQMKILAGMPQNAVFKCMVDHILQHVSWRYIPDNPLAVSGPHLLAKCLNLSAPSERSFTYLDTRSSVYPFTGMRTRDTLLAYEAPKPRFISQTMAASTDESHYATLFAEGVVYSSSCTVPHVGEAPKHYRRLNSTNTTTPSAPPSSPPSPPPLPPPLPPP